MHAKLIVHTGPSVGPKKRRQARWIILTGPSVGPQTNKAGKVDRSHRAFMQAKKHPRLMVQKKRVQKNNPRFIVEKKHARWFVQLENSKSDVRNIIATCYTP